MKLGHKKSGGNFTFRFFALKIECKLISFGPTVFSTKIPFII